MAYYYIYQHADHLRARPCGSHKIVEIDHLVSLDTGIPRNEVTWYGAIEAENAIEAVNKFKEMGLRMPSREEMNSTRQRLAEELKTQNQKDQSMTSPTFWQDSGIQYLLSELDALGDEGYSNNRRSQTNSRDYADRPPNAVEKWMQTRHPIEYAIYLEYGVPMRRRRAPQPSSFLEFSQRVNDNQNHRRNYGGTK